MNARLDDPRDLEPRTEPLLSPCRICSAPSESGLCLDCERDGSTVSGEFEDEYYDPFDAEAYEWDGIEFDGVGEDAA